MKSATIGNMVYVDPKEPLYIPSKFLEILGQSAEGHYLLVFRRATGIIRILPTKGEHAYKLHIEIGELGTNFLEELGDLYERMKITAIFSTGLCFEEDKCYYEAYFDPKVVKEPVESIKEAVAKLNGVIKVFVTKVDA